MIRRIKFWLLVTCLTLRTPNWIKKTFRKICEMDLDHELGTPWGTISGRCSTVIFRGLNGGDFIMAETEPGEVYVKVQTKPGEWVEVYRHNKSVTGFDWIHRLKSVHVYLVIGRAYEEQELCSLMASRKGIM